MNTMLATARTPTPPLPGAGEPADRLARLAARRAFVALKSEFLGVVARLDGTRAEWLRRQVRRAEEPIDLWLLRGAVFSELEAQPHAPQPLAHALRRQLQTLFPDLDGLPTTPAH